MNLQQGSADFFSVSYQIVNILGIVGYMVSGAATQQCCSSPKAASDTTEMQGSVPASLYRT